MFFLANKLIKIPFNCLLFFRRVPNGSSRRVRKEREKKGDTFSEVLSGCLALQETQYVGLRVQKSFSSDFQSVILFFFCAVLPRRFSVDESQRKRHPEMMSVDGCCQQRHAYVGGHCSSCSASRSAKRRVPSVVVAAKFKRERKRRVILVFVLVSVYNSISPFPLFVVSFSVFSSK